MNVLIINIPTVLVPYVQSAVGRLGYLHEDVEWTFDTNGGCLSACYAPDKNDPAKLRKEALFQLYREKIYHDTQTIRKRLYEAI